MSNKVKKYMQQRPTARAAFLLSLPLLWLLLIYIGSLLALFITSIWKIDTFTSKIIRHPPYKILLISSPIVLISM